MTRPPARRLNPSGGYAALIADRAARIRGRPSGVKAASRRYAAALPGRPGPRRPLRPHGQEERAAQACPAPRGPPRAQHPARRPAPRLLEENTAIRYFPTPSISVFPSPSGSASTPDH